MINARTLRRYRLWLFYAAFLALALIFGGREGFVATDSPYKIAKNAILGVYLGFLVYSLRATYHENFFKTVSIMNRLWWGRQVGADLYISVALSLAMIWLIEGSTVVLLLWAVPVIVFANLAILPYILLNYSEIVSALTQ